MIAAPELDACLDARGVEVVTPFPDVVPAIERAVEAFAGHRADLLPAIEACLAIDPALTRAHLLRGVVVRLSGRVLDIPLAVASLRAASASIAERGASDAERSLRTALEAWCERDADRTVDALEAALVFEPTDLFALKASHALQFILGRSRAMRRSVERALPAWRGRGLRGEGAVLGCHAFTLIETGAVADAERVGREACEREENPWSLHAVGHVHHMRGEPELGASWLGRNEHVLTGVGNLALHVRWHAAVFELQCGRQDAALAIYDGHLAKVGADYRDFVNASSLLVRLEHAGVDVGARWQPLADVAEERRGDHGLAFADVHYATALARAGRPASLRAHLASAQRAAERAPGVDGQTLREVGIPVVEALAMERTSTAEAARQMRRLEPSLPRLGGSIPQREMFTLLADGWDATPPITEVRPARPRSAGAT